MSYIYLRVCVCRNLFAKKSDMGVAENQIPFLAVEPECYKVFLDPKLYQADGTIIKHDVTYEGRVEVIFRPKTDTSVISLHVGLLSIVGDPSLKRRLSMDTPTEQVLQVGKNIQFKFGGTNILLKCIFVFLFVIVVLFECKNKSKTIFSTMTCDFLSILLRPHKIWSKYQLLTVWSTLC